MTSPLRFSGEVAVRGVGGRGRALLEAGSGCVLVDGHAVGAVRGRARAAAAQAARRAGAARLLRLPAEPAHRGLARARAAHRRRTEHARRRLPRRLKQNRTTITINNDIRT